MKFACFVTGTDTEIGKTCITMGLMQRFREQGYTVAGMKPVASGSKLLNNEWRNEDALNIQANCSDEIEYRHINPYALQEPIAPHIAARKEGITIQLDPIVKSFEELKNRADVVIVEGVGGWRVPMGDSLQTADLIRALNVPVVLVVGLRLGCINHALLSAETILMDQNRLLGWVANRIDPEYGEVDETIDTISRTIPAPLLGKVPYMKNIAPPDIAARLNRSVFLGNE